MNFLVVQPFKDFFFMKRIRTELRFWDSALVLSKTYLNWCLSKSLGHSFYVLSNFIVFTLSNILRDRKVLADIFSCYFVILLNNAVKFGWFHSRQLLSITNSKEHQRVLTRNLTRLCNCITCNIYSKFKPSCDHWYLCHLRNFQYVWPSKF